MPEVAAFVGAFSALMVLEIVKKWVRVRSLRYVAAFIGGIGLSILLQSAVEWVAGLVIRT